jgi:hypothetical protein
MSVPFGVITHLTAKIAVALVERWEQLVALNRAETMDLITDHLHAFGFTYALRLTLTKED